jgi:hypothetical protein
MVKKAHQNPKGGLNAAGRAHFKRTEGANLKPPAPNPKTEKDAKRRKSFCSPHEWRTRPDERRKGSTDPQGACTESLELLTCHSPPPSP